MSNCGCPNAAPHCLFFRSMTLGYYDLAGDYGTMHFGAQRPGLHVGERGDRRHVIDATDVAVIPPRPAGRTGPIR